MAGICLPAGAADAGSPRGPQSLQERVTVTNIEIPVRVLKGGAFADRLTIADFEVFEDGRPQRIEAVYLVQKADIKREESPKGSAGGAVRPQLARQFVFLFDMSDYMPEVRKAMDFFFDKVILPGDSLIVITPMDSYRIKSEALADRSPSEISEQITGKLRQDIYAGSWEYRSTIDEMFRILNAPEWWFSYPEERLEHYVQNLKKLEALRKVDEKSLLQFAGVLKSTPGQKFVYLFHQMERIPQFSPKAVTQKAFADQDDPYKTFYYMENFDLYKRDVRFDVAAIKKAYADSSITVHFLFITKTPVPGLPISEGKPRTGSGDVAADSSQEVVMVEHSEDIFSAFSEVAKATGGLTVSSFNAARALETAVEASENYYIIYYKPKDYRADGKFHKLSVKVKGGGYSITHRAGYIAQ